MSTEKKNLLRIEPSQKRALALATIVALFVGILFLKSYLMLIIVAAIVAFLFDPVYKWLLLRKVNSGTAVVLTFFSTLLAIIIPLSIVLIITTAQINHLVQSIGSGSYSVDVTEIGTNLINRINTLLVNQGLSYQLNQAEVVASFTRVVQGFGTKMLQSIASSATGIFGFITAAIIYIYVFFSLLKNQKAIIDTTSALNPLGDRISELYLYRMGAMTKAMVRGQFIIASCQGLVSAIGLAIAGLPELFFFFLVLLTVMSIIPLGAGIITIPIGAIMILTGNIPGGILVIANHLIIVTNIDNILRPKLVPKDARLDPALTMLSVFCGLAAFGFPGIVVGPVLMIVITTTIQMFLEVYRDMDALDESTYKDRDSFWKQLKKKSIRRKQRTYTP